MLLFQLYTYIDHSYFHVSTLNSSSKDVPNFLLFCIICLGIFFIFHLSLFSCQSFQLSLLIINKNSVLMILYGMCVKKKDAILST